MKKEKINSFCMSTILVSLCASTFYGVFSSYIINTSKSSSIIALLIGFILSLVLSKIIITFIKRKSNLNYTNKSKLFYPKISKLINTISILCSIFGYILITYRLTTFLSNQYLIETPRYLISLLILCLTYYTSIKGINTAIRVSVVTFFISIAIFFFDAGSLIFQIKLDNFLPLMTVHYKDIIISSVVFAIYFSIPCIYLNTIPYDNITDKDKFPKYYYSMIIVSFIIIFVSVFTCIGVNGSRVTEMFDYPVYSTLKRIKLFSILDSLENVSISAWFLFIINTANIMLIYIFDSTKETFNLKEKGSLISRITIMIIVFIVSNLIFANNNFNESYKYIYIPIIFLGITLLIIIISLFKCKIKELIK